MGFCCTRKTVKCTYFNLCFQSADPKVSWKGYLVTIQVGNVDPSLGYAIAKCSQLPKVSEKDGKVNYITLISSHPNRPEAVLSKCFGFDFRSTELDFSQQRC